MWAHRDVAIAIATATVTTLGILELYRQGRQRLHQFSIGQWDELTRVEFALIYPWWLIHQVIRELIKDRGMVRASSLAFTTVLSIVPVLTVATTLLSGFGTGGDTMMQFVQTFIPFEGETMAGHINQFVAGQAGAISGIGAAVLIVLAVSLFDNIETAFNDIWRVTQSRPALNKFLTFYALITLAPLMIAISIVQTAKVQFVVDQVPFGAALAYKLVPIGLGWVIFTLANKLLPHTRVKWLPALVAGLVTSIAFELAKFGFNVYVTTFVVETYSKVYGAIGLIPIFLLWVYICWVIVLIGAELAYTIQNLRSLMAPAKVRRLADRRHREFSPLIAVSVFSPIAMAFKKGEGPVALESIAASAGVPIDLARTVLDHLIARKVVLEITREGEEDNDLDLSAGFLPARPLNDVPLLHIIRSCRPDDDPHEDQVFLSTLRQLYRAREDETFAALTADALVSRTTWEHTAALASALAATVPQVGAAVPSPRHRSASDVLKRIAIEADQVIGKLRNDLDRNPESIPPTATPTQHATAPPEAAATAPVAPEPPPAEPPLDPEARERLRAELNGLLDP